MSKDIKKLKFANYAIWVMLVLFAISSICWLRPRDTVTVNNFVTDKKVYSVGEEIFIESDSETHFTGKSIYDIRLLCDGGRYLLKGFTVTTSPTSLKQTRTSVGVIPAIPAPDKCVVQTKATHEVQILPFAKRDYFNTWQSNSFVVNKAKE